MIATVLSSNQFSEAYSVGTETKQVCLSAPVLLPILFQ